MELDISFNQISGSIPSDIWRGLPDLEQFKMEGNRLTGTIPAALASLGKLRVLWWGDSGARMWRFFRV
jgi:LRR receptor-like serine/threonine-protein kinase FLS2